MTAHTSDNPLRVVVLISGNGSNLQAIIDSIQEHKLPVHIVAVFSNNPDAFGLQRANKASIPTVVINHREYATREQYDQSLMQQIDSYQPNLIVLAGFMRILTDEFVNHYPGRMINIHPSLLPKYKGTKTHQRVLEAGDHEHGCSVHYVTPELDSGPVIMQAKIAIEPRDTEETLKQKIHMQEHHIYPEAIRWIAEGRIGYQDNSVTLDGKKMSQPLIINQAN